MPATLVKFKSHAPAVKRRIREVLTNRLDAAAAHMEEELAIAVTRPGPSKGGQPPGAVSGELADSIDWYAPEKYQRNIGTPLMHGFWQEMGRATTLRPVNARVLMIPVRYNIPGAKPIHKRATTRKGRKVKATFSGKSGKYKKRYAATFPYVIFRMSAGPRAPRPWVVPTFYRNLKQLGRMVAHRID